MVLECYWECGEAVGEERRGSGALFIGERRGPVDLCAGELLLDAIVHGRRWD